MSRSALQATCGSPSAVSLFTTPAAVLFRVRIFFETSFNTFLFYIVTLWLLRTALFFFLPGDTASVSSVVDTVSVTNGSVLLVASGYF